MINLDDSILNDVNEQELYLLIAITKHINIERKAWPSNESLCKSTKWSVSKVNRVKSDLEDKGLLSIKPRFNKSAQSSNIYQILTEKIGVFVSVSSIKMEDSKNGEGVFTSEQGGCSPANRGGVHQRTAEVLTNEVLTNITTTEKSVDVVTNENQPLKEEPKNPSPVPPHPSPSAPGESAPRRFDAFDIGSAAVELKENAFSAENFARITGTPSGRLASVFTSEVDVFVLEQKGKKTVYNRFDQFSSHFFNYVRAKARDRRSVPSQSQAPSNIPSSLQGLIGK